MENKKIFIGNLDFNVTEDEIKNLITKYGTVVSIKMHQKKGYAFIEMGDSSEAARAVQKLDGVKYKDREMRVSLEMKAGKARSVSVKRYKDRGANLSREKSGSDSDSKPGSEKFRDTSKHKPKQRGNSSASSYKSGERSSGFDEKQSGVNRREKPGMPGPVRDRWATERPDESSRPQRNEWHDSKPSGNESRGGYGSYGRSFEKSLERTSASGNRPLKDYTKERSGTPRSPKREWTTEKPSYTGKQSREGKPSRTEPEYNSREKSSGSADRPFKDRAKDRSGSSRPPKREWTPEKPASQGRTSRDGETISPKKEWSAGKRSGSSGKTTDSWRERPEKKYQGDKPREYSKSRSVSGSTNRMSSSSRPKPGAGRSKSGTPGSKPRGGTGGRDHIKQSGGKDRQ